MLLPSTLIKISLLLCTGRPLPIFAWQTANDTLGFGAIYVVSATDSPRIQSLAANADVTGLHLKIPKIPQWSDEQVQYFRDDDHPDRSTILDGSIKAWMSHTVVLEEFLRSGLSTALIIEDDVDWDIRLKTIQIPSAAATHQFLLGRSSESIWASTHQWDLMYLGHCGDYFTTLDDMQVGTGILHPADLDDIPHVLYRDATLPDPTDLHPFTASFLNAFNVPPNTRLLHQARWPLCSFGYAITRSTAHRLLYELAIPHERPGKWTKAYDIALLEACRDNHLRCFTISPELLHHMEGTSLINGDVADRTERAPADRVGLRQVLYRNETSNIGCGFWSGDFDWHGDLNHLLYLREEVGRKGRCLKPGRREDGSYLPQLPGSGGREQQARVQEPGHRQHITPARVHRKPY